MWKSLKATSKNTLTLSTWFCSVRWRWLEMWERNLLTSTVIWRKRRIFRNSILLSLTKLGKAMNSFNNNSSTNRTSTTNRNNTHSMATLTVSSSITVAKKCLSRSTIPMMIILIKTRRVQPATALKTKICSMMMRKTTCPKKVVVGLSAHTPSSTKATTTTSLRQINEFFQN